MKNWKVDTIRKGVFMSLNLSNLYLFYLSAIIIPSVQTSKQSCPRNVSTEASVCFSEFSELHKSTLTKDKKKLYCDSYTRAMDCISNLKKSCPSEFHPAIDKSTSEILNGGENINSLCKSKVSGSSAQHIKHTCPSSVSTEANKCLTDFSGQYRNIQISDKKLYSGLDVETLRAFCYSYKRAMHCIQILKNSCPQKLHSSIDRSIVNIHSAEAELNALCVDDRLYEVYARNQNCFIRMGPHAETCSDKYLNSSVRPNIVAAIQYTTMEDFCRDIQSILDCIKPDVRDNCGDEAASIVEILVKASFRKSSQCNYVEIQLEQQDDSSHNARDVEPENRKQQQTRATDQSNNPDSSAANISCDFLLLTLLLIISCFYSTRRKWQT